jgi:hypothetical protein
MLGKIADSFRRVVFLLGSFEQKRRTPCHMGRDIWGFFIGAQYSLTAPVFFPAFAASLPLPGPTQGALLLRAVVMT